MRIHDLNLVEEEGIFCKKSNELYFNFDEGEADYSDYKSMAAFWIDEVIEEPEFNDEALENAWEDYCEKHEEQLEDEGLEFEFILSFLKKQKRDDLQALYCCYSAGITSWSCILVVNQDFEIKKF